MKRTEAECCDVVMTHTGTVEEVKKKMPGDGMIHDLADFIKYLEMPREYAFCVFFFRQRYVSAIWRRYSE